MNRSCILLGVALSLLFQASAGIAGAKKANDKDSTYPIREHGVGRWFAIDVPLPVSHKLDTRGLTDYKLTLTVDVLTHKEKPPEPELNLAVTSVFKNVIRPESPGTSHVQLVIDGKATGEYLLKAYAFEAGGDEQTAWLKAKLPVADYRALVQAKRVEGRLYWRADDGKEVRQNDLRTFTLDAKALRSLKELDKKVQ